MKQHIIQALLSRRRELGLSQHELAVRAGLRREKLNRIESQGENIGLDELCRLLDAAGLELEVRVKDRAAAHKAPGLQGRPRELKPREFRKAAFLRGANAKIVDWGKVPK